MFFTFGEFFDILVIVAFMGYFFKDLFQKPARMATSYEDDPVSYYKHSSFGFNWNDFWFAAMVTAPAVILHEFGHKFVAIGFGEQATFHAAYMFLGLGLLLKMMNFGFIFFVPAFVSHTASNNALQSAAIGFAGPAVNLVLWIGTWYLLKQKFVRKKKWIMILGLTSKVNMLLFFFNMIPIPPFDGYHVFAGLFHAVF